MTTAQMERVLAGIRPEEVRDFLRMLSLWERAGWVDREEAARWKQRISRAQAPVGSGPAPDWTAATNNGRS